MVKISEIQCKSILTKSRIPGVDYVICPYIGCLHQCLYCYVRFMGFVKEEWGRFLYVKANGTEVLKRQIQRAKEKSRISISTATDPYQPTEKKYQLTRRILKEILPYKHSVSILTKSVLVRRDIDILKDMWDVEVGFSITTTDETARKFFEPYTSSIDDRFLALEELNRNGVKTWVFIAPVLPYFTEKSLPELMKRLKETGVQRITVDKLNYAGRLRLDERLREHYPQISEMYRDKNRVCCRKVKELVIRLANDYRIAYSFCF